MPPPSQLVVRTVYKAAISQNTREITPDFHLCVMWGLLKCISAHMLYPQIGHPASEQWPIKLEELMNASSKARKSLGNFLAKELVKGGIGQSASCPFSPLSGALTSFALFVAIGAVAP